MLFSIMLTVDRSDLGFVFDEGGDDGWCQFVGQVGSLLLLSSSLLYVLDILNKPLNSKSQNKANAHARERDERE
jgi:hypothetical protein